METDRDLVQILLSEHALIVAHLKQKFQLNPYSMNLAHHMSTAATLFCESIQVCTVCTEVLWFEMRPTSLVSSDI